MKSCPGTNHGCGARWEYYRGGYSVLHCGHPTANYPWYGLTPEGAMILSHNGMAFSRLQPAMEAVEVAEDLASRNA